MQRVGPRVWLLQQVACSEGTAGSGDTVPLGSLVETNSQWGLKDPVPLSEAQRSSEPLEQRS